MKKSLLLMVVMMCVFAIYAKDKKQQQPDKIYSREEIAGEIRDTEKEYQDAKAMFNPWYAGPLLTPSPNIIDPGLFNVQPYLFVKQNYGSYSRSGSATNIPNLFQVNPAIVAQYGIVKHLEILATVQGLYSKQNGRSSFNYMDTDVKIGIEILKQTPYRPAIAFDIGETFPSGKYRKLNPDKGGVDATGAGSYQTNFSFNIGKVIWWIPTHPMNARLSLNYTIASNASVKGFNAYGGGYGTDGTVNVGNNFTGDFGYEYSFTKKWVVACDVVYTYTSPSKFSGNPGVDRDGNAAIVGGPFNDQLSLAPAIEYNPSEKLGVLAGVWFSVWGRNSLQFVSGVFTLEYTF